MSWLVVALTLSTCEHPGLATLPTSQQGAACELLARPPPERIELTTLRAIYERPGFERARQRNSGALQSLMAQLTRWFEKLFESSGAETYSNITRVLVLILALVIGGGVTLRFLARRRGQALAPVRAPSSTALELDDPTEHLARAEALLGNSPREAIREALLSLLSSLERRRFARSLPRRDVSVCHLLREPVLELTDALALQLDGRDVHALKGGVTDCVRSVAQAG